jgi:1A family penicillin-binding protein
VARIRRKKTNDNPAPNTLINSSLVFISKLLVTVGKPLHFVLCRLVQAIMNIPRNIKEITQLLSSIPQSKKLSINKIVQEGKASARKTQTKLDDFLWKIQVAPLALTKLLKKITPIIKIKTLLPPITHLQVGIPKIIKSKRLMAFLALSFLASFSFSIVFWKLILKDLPSPRNLVSREVEISTKIYDRNGSLLYNIYKNQNRTLVKLANIPLHVQLATLAIEDAEFYSHPGFSIKGMVRAIIKNIRENELTGGSTITQQLVKNALLSSEKTLIRKLKELTLAVMVELSYSKNEILEMYLNEVSYGGTAYGIQEASRAYFDKEVDELTLSEAALLAGLPKSPTKFSPFGPNPSAALTRQKQVLKLMQINKYITQEQRERAENEEIVFAENKTDMKAPHFVMYTRQKLEDKYGKELVEKGGLEVITTLDLRIQELAEEVVRNEVSELTNLNVTNGAALVINPSSGEILAMVGSINYFDTEQDGNVNVTTRSRQPGSSIKIINYAYALSNGYTPATIITDSPVTFLVDKQPPYTPKNYEGGFRGNMTLRSALAESRNIPAVKVLSSYGVKNMLDLGTKMGITTWKNPDNYGLSLTLGGGEVKLMDLAQAYATVANYGRRPELKSVLKITNHKGKVLEENKCENEKVEQIEQLAQTNQGKQLNKLANSPLVNAAASESALGTKNRLKITCQGEQVLDPRVAYILTDILRDNAARAPAFGENSLLVIPNHAEVAVKTGTSNNLRDNLAVGYNQNYIVAAWVGNNDNSEMARIASGVTGATPIFNKIMSVLLANAENDNWPVPEGLVQLPICPYTNTLACAGCPIKTEWFLEENRPESTCEPDWFAKEKENLPLQSPNAETGQILPEAATHEVIDIRFQSQD